MKEEKEEDKIEEICMNREPTTIDHRTIKMIDNNVALLHMRHEN